MAEECNYEIEGAPWSVENADEFFTRFSLTSDLLPNFHGWASKHPNLTVCWTAVRLLYGINPVVPAGESNPDYYGGEWMLPTIARELKTDVDSCLLEIDMGVRSWKRYLANQVERPKPTPKKVEEPPKPSAEVIEYSKDPPSQEQIALLEKHGFDLGDFIVEKSAKDGKARSESKRNQEIQWFCGRLKDLERALLDPMGKTRARQILINELSVRRIDERVMRLSADDPSIDRMVERKQETEKLLIQQWSEITKACPYIQQQTSKIVAVLAVSEFMEGLRNFKANKNNDLRDGIYTASEILVVDRESVQQGTHYRPGWVRYHLEADAGLWDQNWRPTMPQVFCQTLDMAHIIARKAVNEKLGIKLPNLLSDGKDGEYPDLPDLPDSAQVELAEEGGRETVEDEMIIMPLQSVPLEGDVNGSPEQRPSGE